MSQKPCRALQVIKRGEETWLVLMIWNPPAVFSILWTLRALLYSIELRVLVNKPSIVRTSSAVTMNISSSPASQEKCCWGPGSEHAEARLPSSLSSLHSAAATNNLGFSEESRSCSPCEPLQAEAESWCTGSTADWFGQNQNHFEYRQTLGEGVGPGGDRSGVQQRGLGPASDLRRHPKGTRGQNAEEASLQ